MKVAGFIRMVPRVIGRVAGRFLFAVAVCVAALAIRAAFSDRTAPQLHDCPVTDSITSGDVQ